MFGIKESWVFHDQSCFVFGKTLKKIRGEGRFCVWCMLPWLKKSKPHLQKARNPCYTSSAPHVWLKPVEELTLWFADCQMLVYGRSLTNRNTVGWFVKLLVFWKHNREERFQVVVQINWNKINMLEYWRANNSLFNL